MERNFLKLKVKFFTIFLTTCLLTSLSFSLIFSFNTFFLSIIITCFMTYSFRIYILSLYFNYLIQIVSKLFLDIIQSLENDGHERQKFHKIF